MKSAFFLVAGIGCLVLAPANVRAQSFEETLGLQTTSITMHEVIAQILDKSLDVKIEWMNWSIADQQISAAAGKFDPLYFLDASYLDSRLPQNAIEFAQTGGVASSATESNLFRQQNLLMSTGISGKLPLGTQYGIFTETGRFRNDLNRIRPPSIFYPEYSAAAGIVINQPLLRDFGSAVQYAEIRVTRRNRAIADYKWEIQLQRTLADVILDYYDLMLVMQNIALKREVLAFTRDMGTLINKRIAEGGQVDFTVQDADLAASVAEEDVVKALALAADRQVKLKSQIMGGMHEESGRIYLAKDQLQLQPADTDRKALVQKALLTRPDHLASLEELEKQVVLDGYMKNQKLPRLDIQTRLSTEGLSGNYGDAYSRAANRQGYEAQIGFRFSVPLGNNTARANSATAEYLRQQAMLNVARSELNVAIEISTGIGRVKGARAKLTSVRNTVGKAGSAVAQARDLDREGAIGFSGIFKAKLQETEARTREIEALVEYNKATVQLALVSGILLKQYGVQVERGGNTAPAAIKTSGKRR